MPLSSLHIAGGMMTFFKLNGNVEAANIVYPQWTRPNHAVNRSMRDQNETLSDTELKNRQIISIKRKDRSTL
jgi:hypothetical protein